MVKFSATAWLFAIFRIALNSTCIHLLRDTSQKRWYEEVTSDLLLDGLLAVCSAIVQIFSSNPSYNNPRNWATFLVTWRFVSVCLCISEWRLLACVSKVNLYFLLDIQKSVLRKTGCEACEESFHDQCDNMEAGRQEQAWRAFLKRPENFTGPKSHS